MKSRQWVCALLQPRLLKMRKTVVLRMYFYSTSTIFLNFPLHRVHSGVLVERVECGCSIFAAPCVTM